MKWRFFANYSVRLLILLLVRLNHFNLPLPHSPKRIAVERKRYNDALQDYNTYVQQFPNSLFAGWAGFKPNEAYFEASAGSREVPKVNFASPSTSAPQPAPGALAAVI